MTAASSSGQARRDSLLPRSLLLYDGECGLCDKAVQWILDRDPDAAIAFAPLQGPTAEAIFARHPDIPPGIDSVMFVSQRAGRERVSWRSRAVLGALGELRFPWRALSWLRVLPPPLLDLGYRFIAGVRFKIWGRLETCRVPSADERRRFLP